MSGKRRTSHGKSLLAWLEQWPRRNKSIVVMFGVFGVFAVLIGAYNDTRQIIQDGLSPFSGLFWCGPFDWTFLVLAVLLAAGAIYLTVSMRAERHDRHVILVPRFPMPVRTLSAMFVGLAFSFAVFVVVQWNTPPAKTVILVADFDDPTDEYGSDIFTSVLAGSIEDVLRPHPNMEVKRLFRPISDGPDSGRVAERLGQCPLNRASIVIWGNVVRERDNNEVLVHFKIIPKANAIGNSVEEMYGPTDIQADLPIFTQDLGEQLGQLSAYASGLAMLLSGNYRDSSAMFETAYRSGNQTVRMTNEVAESIQFFRALTAFFVGQVNDAVPLFQALTGPVYDSAEAPGAYTRAALTILQGFYREYQPPEKNFSLSQDVLAYARRTGDRTLEVDALQYMHLAAQDKENYGAADQYAAEAAGIAAEIAETAVVATPTISMARGEQVYSDSCMCDPWQVVFGHEHSAAVAREAGQYEIAFSELESALDIVRHVGGRGEEALILKTLGNIAHEQEQCDAANHSYQEALEIFRDLNLTYPQGDTLRRMAWNAYECSRFEEAQGYLEEALPILMSEQAAYDAYDAESLLGHTMYVRRDYPEAISHYTAAIDYCDAHNLVECQAYLSGWMGKSHGYLGDWEDAQSTLEYSKVLYSELGEPFPGEFQEMLDFVSLLRGASK